ncbi:MAG: hypothetical protein M1832_002253 [Thelocarpon impressellum]|nr:MAG: hypothetical protein M1832_002253 [Thelocarpon impressellum]
MVPSDALYLGFDLSTQQLKAIAITSNLKPAYDAQVEFDRDLPSHGVEKGVHVNKEKHEVFAPVAMWLEAVDLVLQKLKDQGMDFGRVRGLSGAGQQHGSVYWSDKAESLLQGLDKSKSLVEQLAPAAFSYPDSPNWQDASTQAECDLFDGALGSPEELANVTGSKAHHRFTGPQILRFRTQHTDAYRATARISLVSSFLASLFLGRVAPIDIGDVGGMNLWDIKAGSWCEPLLKLTAGDDGVDDVREKLGDVREDGGGSLGQISKWFVERHGFSPDCAVAPFTGDNPSSILSLPLKAQDAIVSLGTSTTFLMSTPHYRPDPSYHFMNHPTTPGLYMFMLCYKNGGLARENVRDAIDEASGNDGLQEQWGNFNQAILDTPPLLRAKPGDPVKMGLYFPLPEIVPNVRAGVWRFKYTPESGELTETKDGWDLPTWDARAIVESQLFSLRLRSQKLVGSSEDDESKDGRDTVASIPPQPRNIYLTGGGAQNAMIANSVGDMLGGVEGVHQLDVGGSGCALGAAHKAVWALERTEGQTFEDLIGLRWNAEGAVTKVHEGYQKGLWEEFGKALPGFEAMEKQVIQEDRNLQMLEDKHGQKNVQPLELERLSREGEA